MDGSTGKEVWRMADYMIDELERTLEGKPLECEITQEMLERMA
jgi:hypothetical protein